TVVPFFTTVAFRTLPAGVMTNLVWIFASVALTSAPARDCSQQRSISGCFVRTRAPMVSWLKGIVSGAGVVRGIETVGGAMLPGWALTRAAGGGAAGRWRLRRR